MAYLKLRSRIVEKYGTQRRFADALSVSYVTVSAKLTGAKEFSKSDMIKWGSLLGISPNQYTTYFFD